jgi:hypothetical protein
MNAIGSAMRRRRSRVSSAMIAARHTNPKVTGASSWSHHSGPHRIVFSELFALHQLCHALIRQSVPVMRSLMSGKWLPLMQHVSVGTELDRKNGGSN